MAEQVLELIARITPEGAEETTEALEDAEQSFEETADTIEDESERLEDFSERFKGALSVAVTGLAIASAGLLSNVPALQESFVALSALVERLGLSISETFGPTLSGLTQTIQDLGRTSGDSTESLRRIRDILIGLGGAGAIAGAGLGLAISPLVGAAALAIGFAFGVALVISELSGLTNATTLSEQEFTGWKGVLQDVLTLLTGPLLIGLGVLSGFIENGIPGAVDGAIQAFSILLDAGNDLFVGLAAGIAEFSVRGLQLFNNFFDVLVNDAKKSFNSLLDIVERTVNDILSRISGLPGIGDFGSVSLGRFNVESNETIRRRNQIQTTQRISNIRANRQRLQSGNITDKLSEVLDRLASNREGDTVLQIDSRTVAREIGGRLGEGVGDRGR